MRSPGRIEDRPVILALVFDQDRLVVGDELGEQADEEQDEEDPQRPEAAPVGLEDFEPPPLKRRQPRPRIGMPWAATSSVIVVSIGASICS